MHSKSPLQVLMNTLPREGRVEWIGVRPARGELMVALDSVKASTESGLEGDRFAGRAEQKRQVTLIQWEHLPVIAACLGRDDITSDLLRRNIVVSGINLLALKDKSFRIGGAVLQTTGLCHPCSKMERVLGPGGYNALRGHGGITARVISDGSVRIGDAVAAVTD